MKAGQARPADLGKGVFWTFVQSWGVQACNLLLFAILARLLPPSAFGLVAFAQVYVHLVSVFADQGIASAVIQRKDLDAAHTDTAFWANLAMGAMLTLVGVAAAGPLSLLMGEPELRPVLRGLSFVFVLNAFKGVQEALLQRSFQFRYLAARSLFATIGGGIAGVAMALTGWGAMALVAEQIVASAVGIVVLWSAGGWRPGFRFSRSHLRELYGFGIRIVGIRLLNVASKRADNFLVGVMLGPTALGYYSVGYKLMMILLDLLSKVFTRVALPAFAAVQSDVAELRRSLISLLRLTSLVAAPSFAIVALFAAELVPVIFGAQWHASVMVLRILAAGGAARSLTLIGHQAMIATGRPGLALRFLGVTTLASLAGFAAGAVYGGINGVAVGFTIVSVVSIPYCAWLMRQATGVRILSLAPAFRASAPALGVMLVAGVVMDAVMPASLPVLLRAALAVPLALTVYAAVALRVEPDLVNTLRAMLKPRARAARVRVPVAAGATEVV